MKLRFVNKTFKNRKVYSLVNNADARLSEESANEVNSVVEKPKNKRTPKQKSDMNDMEKIANAEELMAAMAPEVKVVKKDRGLIERTESSKIILTEDNRQVLND